VGVGDTVSLIAMSPVAEGVSTTGLEYPLSGDDLYFGSTRGVSNVQVAPQARVTLRSGVLLCVTVPQSAVRNSNPDITP
jgi:thiamine pyrophosphokinase